MLHSESRELLAQLGLAPNEARVFWTLSQTGPATAKTISKQSGVAREIVYQIMPKLQKKCLVEEIIATPKKFRATPINDSLKNLLQNKTEEFTKLKAKTELLIDASKTLNSINEQETKSPQFVLVPQGKAVIQKANEMLRKTQKSVDLVLSWRRFAYGLNSTFIESAKKAWRRNVKYRFIVEDPRDVESMPKVLENFKKNPACQIRFIPTQPKTVVGIYDEKEVFIIIDPKTDLPDSPALWTDNQSLIALAQDTFENLWNRSNRKTKPRKHPSQQALTI